MTELAWHRVGAAEEAPVGFLRRVEVEGAAVCLGRTADGWVAFQDTCTHEECSLADGELEDGVIVCPCHASERRSRVASSCTRLAGRSFRSMRTCFESASGLASSAPAL